MIVHEGYEAIFLHNPRCAGSLISDALREQYWFKHHWELNVEMPPDKHNIDIPECWKHYTIYTTCRNPYAREVSWWAKHSYSPDAQCHVGTFDYYTYGINLQWGGVAIDSDQVRWTELADVVFRLEDFPSDTLRAASDTRLSVLFEDTLQVGSNKAFRNSLKFHFGELDITGRANSSVYDKDYSYYSELTEERVYNFRQDDFEKLGYERYTYN
jgi:hypothetical protein